MNNCTSKDPSVKLLKFADNTTLISLIQDDDESAYRKEVKELVVWCSLRELIKLNLQQELLKQPLPSLNPSSAHQYLSGSFQLLNLTSEDYGG